MKYFIIRLSYLGKYKKEIKKSEKIPENKFTKSILKTNILEKLEMNKEINKNMFDFDLNKYITKDLKQSFIIAIYDITSKDINKKIQILNYDNSNKSEIEKICNIYLNEKKLDFSFEYIFNKPGKYTFKLEFNDLLKNANKLFYKCNSLISINVERFKSNYINDMTDMFNGCYKLESLDLSNFKTKEVKSMKRMFKQCNSLNNLDLSSFDTSQVTDMTEMFSECNSLTILKLSNFQTTEVKSMNRMFYKCSSLSFLNISSFQYFNIDNFSEMFRECSSLDYLYSSTFEINHIINSDKMFYNCSFFKLLEEVFLSEKMASDEAKNSIEILLKDMIFNEGYITSQDIQNYIQKRKNNKIEKNYYKYENNNICNNLINNKNENNKNCISSLQKIFQTDEFNNLTIEEFSKKYKNNENFEKLIGLKEIIEDIFLSKCRLSPNHLDSRGNKIDGWSLNEKRGNKLYDPPIGWIGLGLKVIDKYEDNKWLGKNNSKGEWCIAYHGIANSQSSENVKMITGNIIKSQFKNGSAQMHRNCDDEYHPGKKVGNGVYFSSSIKFAEKYAGIVDIKGKKFKIVLMVRVKPEAIRHCSCNSYIWVVNGTCNEIRPYRILYKKIDD